MLYYSGDGGAQWTTAYYEGDGGLGFNDLGFTTATDGVVVYGPALSDDNAEGRPGWLLLTSNGGASWQPVTFCAGVRGRARAAPAPASSARRRRSACGRRPRAGAAPGCGR